DDAVTWWAMWEEGLATYISQRMNPSLPAQQVLWFPTDIVARMQAPGVMVRAAKLMLENFDKSDSAHSLFFESGHSTSGLPPRAGYYMGYRMAVELGRDHSLAWLARLHPADVKTRARAFLEKTANGN
ncbi:MAG TPA: hypothetical protein VH000_11545, partial [Rhizomicrobium sp.]|nr:hypothetical protein [Rhizomicrobium sp.]